MGAAFVQDAISLSGLGLAAKAIGSVPALSTELGGIAGAYGGNIGGEYLVNKYGAPNWVQDSATFLGGSVGGAAGSFAGNVYRNYRTLKNYNEIGYTGVPGKRVDGDPNAPRMSDVAKDYKGVM